MIVTIRRIHCFTAPRGRRAVLFHRRKPLLRLLLPVIAAETLVLGFSCVLPAAAGLDFDTAECAVRAVLIVAAAEYAAADGLATHLTLAHFHCSLHWFYH